jgi:glycosyltransferase involved in cell wall biosynthesis
VKESLMDEVKKKRVCVFTLHPTKDLRVFNRQCCSLQRNGWDVTLIGYTSEGNYEENGVKVIGVKKWTSISDRIRVIFKIAYLAYKQKADIYHFHDPDLLIPAVFLRILTFKPVIYDIHEYFHINQLEKLPKIWLLQTLVSFIIWSTETVCGTFLGYISAVYEEHIRRFSRLGCKTVHTPNYASIQEFVPEPISAEEWQSRRKRVISTGTLDPIRGSLLLLDIGKELKKRRPDIELVVTRRFHTKKQEDAMMAKMSLPEYKGVVNFTPNVDGKQLPKVVRSGGVALSPVLDIFQNKLIVPTRFFEYMSQAVPIVASDLPNSRKYVADEGCGFLAVPDKPEEYVEAIIKLVDNPKIAMEMGEKGQKAFIEKYNWGVVEKRLVEFYESISK